MTHGPMETNMINVFYLSAYVGAVLTCLQALKDRSYLDIINGLFIPKYEVNSAR